MTTPAARPVLCRVHIRPGRDDISLDALIRVISRQSRPAILGGNHSVERYSMLCAEPTDQFQFKDGQDRPFEKLQQALETYRLADHDFPDGLPLPGWIGYFAYPLAENSVYPVYLYGRYLAAPTQPKTYGLLYINSTRIENGLFVVTVDIKVNRNGMNYFIPNTK